jgi:hypothetical protein
MNNTNFGNIILVVILVLLVGFGVWYFTVRSAPAAPSGIDVHIDGALPGGSDDGTSDQGGGTGY